MAPTAPNTPSMVQPVAASKAGRTCSTRPCAAPPLRRRTAFTGALMPACWMTLAHFSMSPLRKVSNWAGVMVMGTAPCLAQASRIAGLATILVISLFSRSTTSLGVPAGAMMPSQMVAS